MELSGTTSRQPRAQVDSAVGVIQNVAKEKGLEPDCIEALMDFVAGEGGVSNGWVCHLVTNEQGLLLYNGTSE